MGVLRQLTDKGAHMIAKRLALYHNDDHIVIATSRADAAAVMRETTGDPDHSGGPFMLLARGTDRINPFGRGYRLKTATEHIRLAGRARAYFHSYEYPAG